jgi:hypothetical protein
VCLEQRPRPEPQRDRQYRVSYRNFRQAEEKAYNLCKKLI